ncbi:MAG: type II toxin-antitoxin system Phd/YefM family antitoxin [Hyphomicrobiales bacterium]
MKTMTAAKAKTHFGEFLDTAQREPVIVTKKNRPVGVLFSMQDIEDTIWGEKARKSHAEGYLSAKDSKKALAKLLNAKG